MAETINSNVFDATKKFVDFAGLDYFWDKAKAYVDGVDAELTGKISGLETTVGDTNSGLVKEVNALRAEVNALGGVEGGINGMIDAKINALDLPNTYDAKGSANTAEINAKAYVDDRFTNEVTGKFDVVGSAATAETAAKGHADQLNTAMDARVKVLEAIDHEKLASDASAAAVATVLDGAPEKFDTLKEVAQWIADSESAASAADLVNRVKALEDIDHEAYKAADATLKTEMESYADGVGTAANGYTDGEVAKAKTYAEEKATAAKTAANGYTDGKISELDTKAQGYASDAEADAIATAAADATSKANAAQAAAIAQAKDDAAKALENYYTKAQVDGLLSTKSSEDRAYAATYTDTLFNSIQFAKEADIDTIFA